MNIISPDRLHVFYGFSKDFAAAGLRLGCLITQNTLLWKSVKSNTRFHGGSGLSIAVAVAILEDEEFVASFLALSRQKIGDAYRYATSFLQKNGNEYWRGSTAGFFIYLNLSPWLLPKLEDPEYVSEYDFAQELLDAGVEMHPREEHWEEPGHFRLVFGHERERLGEGVRR
ncbi:PLP-dependent transferase [Mytilinidion resinicola]|uniref:PLP-dependent transferase n=1 Tax=Mytilinidion resinicola TaxID=574789 RepID=A0A6A6YGK0_9PEZI|nr:PLP-dependent transferase [Mytilinidion resinicola]KAF2807027.1 PLP-dependent transferase [Mytilinidion resinicola]